MRIGIAISLVIGFLVGTSPSQEAGSRPGRHLEVDHRGSGRQSIASDQLKGGKLVIKGNNYTVTIPKRSTITGTQKLGLEQVAQDDRHHGRRRGQQGQDLPRHLRGQGGPIPGRLRSARKSPADDLCHGAGQRTMDARLEAHED